MSDLVKRLRSGIDNADSDHMGHMELGGVVSTMTEAADALTEQAAEIDRLKTGLARIALPCAFYVATSVVNPEAFARMIYAEKVWSGIEPSEADDQTEIETRNRYPLQGDKT